MITVVSSEIRHASRWNSPPVSVERRARAWGGVAGAGMFAKRDQQEKMWMQGDSRSTDTSTLTFFIMPHAPDLTDLIPCERPR